MRLRFFISPRGSQGLDSQVALTVQKQNFVYLHGLKHTAGKCMHGKNDQYA